MALGFAGVTLNASDRITANHRGSLAVYQSQGAYTSGSGYAYSGGNLTLNTPLLTGAAGRSTASRRAATCVCWPPWGRPRRRTRCRRWARS
ncbi:hypothetical protein WJ972_13335 [Achromobacter insuavis]